MVVTTSLIDMLVLSMMYDVSRSLQRELNYQLSSAILLPYFCGHSKRVNFGYVVKSGLLLF